MTSSTNIFRCSACKVTYSVSSKDPDIHLLQKDVRCPNHPCNGIVVEIAKTNARVKAVKVKAVELYQAHQMGFSSERKCGPAELTKMLTGTKVISVDVDKTSDPDKSILRSITLEGGRTLHLAPSTIGVVVLKVTENRNVR